MGKNDSKDKKDSIVKIAKTAGKIGSAMARALNIKRPLTSSHKTESITKITNNENASYRTILNVLSNLKEIETIAGDAGFDDIKKETRKLKDWIKSNHNKLKNELENRSLNNTQGLNVYIPAYTSLRNKYLNKMYETTKSMLDIFKIFNEIYAKALNDQSKIEAYNGQIQALFNFADGVKLTTDINTINTKWFKFINLHKIKLLWVYITL